MIEEPFRKKLHFVIKVQLMFGLGHMETAVLCLVTETVLKCFYFLEAVSSQIVNAKISEGQTHGFLIFAKMSLCYILLLFCY